MVVPCLTTFRVCLFLPTAAETLCTTECATVCWEEIPTTCGAHYNSRPPDGKQFKFSNPRGVTGPNGGGVQTCPGSLVKVNEEECKALGARDGFTFGGTVVAQQYAPGCFDHGIFYYNTHPTGSQGEPGALWCKHVGANRTYHLPNFVHRSMVVGFRLQAVTPEDQLTPFFGSPGDCT
jgi:hypothetical protein